MTSENHFEKLLYRLIALAVLAAALFFVCRIVYAGIIALPYPKELLEPSNIALTNTFLQGRSPYTLSSLEWEVPPVNYDYPFLNSLIAAAIAKITCCSSVTAHFVISLISIIGSGIVGALMIKDQSRTPIAPAMAAIMFMFCHWRFGYISAAPDDLGLFITILTMYLAVNPKVKNKPLCCSLGITLAFYTKQYFVVIAAGIFVYLLFYSRKEAFKLAIWTCAINAAIAAVITEFWPLYWTKAFLFTYLGTVVGGGTELSTFFEQFKYLFIAFAALFIVIIVAAVMAVRRLRKNNEKLKNVKILENDALAFCAINSFVMLVPLFILGRNDGAFLSYFLQLWLPSISITALICLERMKPDDSLEPSDSQRSSASEESSETISSNVSGKTNKYNQTGLVYIAIYAMIAVTSIYFGFGKLPLHILTPEEISNWEKAYSYVDEYAKEGEVFYSRSLAYKAFAAGSSDCVYGHDGEVSDWTIKGLERAGVPVEHFPYIRKIVDQNIAFRQKQQQMAENGDFALISAEKDEQFNPFCDDAPLQMGYQTLESLDLQLGNMPYEVVFYTPNSTL